MGSTFTETYDSVRPSRIAEPHFNVSPIRSRVLKESIAANRKERGATRRPAKWTKRPKYEGFQSTLDLNDGLKPLQSFKKPKRDPAATSFASSLTNNSVNHNETLISLSSGDEESQSIDPMMVELQSMLEKSPYAYDQSEGPMMRELNEIVSATYTEPIHSTNSKLSSHEVSQTLEVVPLREYELSNLRSISHPELACEDRCKETYNPNIPLR